ncbi:MAG: hypothetical protein SFY68_04550 [Candidatus Sumerlaeia bacterium]|nr:hypothetical protein [Candidatus Sumerlaeia bacterium]
MTEVTVRLSDNMKSYLDSIVNQSGYQSPGDYLAELVRKDMEKNARQELDEIILAGINSGESREWNSETLSGIRQRISNVNGQNNS